MGKERGVTPVAADDCARRCGRLGSSRRDTRLAPVGPLRPDRGGACGPRVLVREQGRPARSAERGPYGSSYRSSTNVLNQGGRARRTYATKRGTMGTMKTARSKTTTPMAMSQMVRSEMATSSGVECNNRGRAGNRARVVQSLPTGKALLRVPGYGAEDASRIRRASVPRRTPVTGPGKSRSGPTRTGRRSRRPGRSRRSLESVRGPSAGVG